MKITPLRGDLTECLDEEQLHLLKKKLDVELKILKFLGLFRVADTDCISFARDENEVYIYTEQSARFYAKKHARTLYDEELIDIYLVKYNSSCGRGENIYVINDNGLRLLGLEQEFDVGLNDIGKYIRKTQYAVFKTEQLIRQGYKILNVFNNNLYIHIKYSNKDDIINEYILHDEYQFRQVFKSFKKSIHPYNDTYTILIDEAIRGKELKAVLNENINPVVLFKQFQIVEKRNSRNQKTLRPNLVILGGC